ncbi:hypothetical protein [Raoultella terrigena]|uniref:hypothetical protein n=1 Tax=Raoultella terrigena TaxID=577 RepID=UPI00158C7187|nr:hypothetical protein [Raoultella terrigena]
MRQAHASIRTIAFQAADTARALAAAEDRGVEVQIVVDTRHSCAKASRVAMK